MPASYEIHAEDEMQLFLRSIGRSEEALFSEYMQTGYAIHSMIREVLRRLGRRLDEVGALLEFASGYGRVVRFLLDDLPRDRVTVADIYAEAVRFQAATFGVRGVPSATEPDEVDLGGPYDLITCISLFSHLPERLFRRWLAELAGALAPDGLLLFTTHGPNLDDRGRPADYAFVRSSESRSLDRGSYGSTFVSRAFVERQVDELLGGRRILAHFPAGANAHQDVYVVGPGSLEPIPPADLTLPRIFLDAVVVAEGRMRCQGWALAGNDAVPARRLRALLDDAEVHVFATGVERPDLAAIFGVEASSAGFDASFPCDERVRAGVFSLEAEDERGLTSRIFRKLPSL